MVFITCITEVSADGSSYKVNIFKEQQMLFLKQEM